MFKIDRKFLTRLNCRLELSVTDGRRFRKRFSLQICVYSERGDLILSSVMAQSLPTDPVVVLGSPDEVHPGKINEASVCQRWYSEELFTFGLSYKLADLFVIYLDSNKFLFSR